MYFRFIEINPEDLTSIYRDCYRLLLRANQVYVYIKTIENTTLEKLRFGSHFGKKINSLKARRKIRIIFTIEYGTKSKCFK